VAPEILPGRVAGADIVATLWRDAWQPDRATDTPPSWLRSAQHDSWRRAIAAIEGWGGAILADPVGSGKSWIALAAAQRFNARPLVIGPAALAAQWLATAARANVPVHWHSHERCSRGRLPAGRSSFVIVDEAHRFRHLQTRRARTLAPWLVGRRALFLTATPIINRRADLMALLRLLVADDALALDGIGSIRALETAQRPPAALARLIIRSAGDPGNVPLHHLTLSAHRSEAVRGRTNVRSVARMALGSEPGVRSLVATVLLDAAGSSDAAWRASLRRYRALLLQSRDAGGLSRAALRRFAGPALEQLVLWPLLDRSEVAGAPPAEDLPLVESLLEAPPPVETWLTQVSELLADQQPTICFTRYRATAHALVRRLGARTAWVTGSAAGIGPYRVPREQVLTAFGPEREQWQLFRQRPNCLVCTEVVAEGLNLQGASRVVHLDLPWNASRLEQRVGRVRRIGQLASNVTVVVRAPTPAIERVLGMQRLVRRKGRLSERWLSALTVSRSPELPPAPASWFAVAGGQPGDEAVALVGLAAGQRRGTIALEQRNGRWQASAPGSVAPRHILAGDAMAPFALRDMHRRMRRVAWCALELALPPSVARPVLVSRALMLARDARHARDHHALHRLDSLLALVARHVPLGLEEQLTRLATAPDDHLRHASLPMPEQVSPTVVAWSVLVLFRREQTRLR
jgi:hypothetical protein